MRLVWIVAAILAMQPLTALSQAGLDPAVLSPLDADMASGKYGNMDSVLILNRGQVALDRAYKHDYHTIYADADKETWRDCASAAGVRGDPEEFSGSGAGGRECGTFFNEHYQELGPTPGYLWFQSRMCLTSFDEKPVPTFKRVLAETVAKNEL